MENTASSKSPSLLVQIINKVDAMTENEQRRLWIQLNKEELLREAKLLDDAIVPSNLSEEEIVALCKSARKE
jgi:hypothetical protein